ncbi:hypothetical protein [Cohnella sp. REN36]|uniref:hypothetical protein n=1 Tax=Cohnella sp. REN36 TaxID=2887347 RepID=UPI001D1402E7|nr:hypothetical protein [Cohnella sp. REN36]MCC3373866.1 hypothetical protein [Cohnella sp. REN36]
MKRSIVLACCVAVVAGAVVFAGERAKSPGTASPEPYVESQVIETPSGFRVHIRNPKRLDEVVNYAKYIVEGKIVAAEDLAEPISLQEGTPERAISEQSGMGAVQTRHGTNYTIQVLDSIKGQLQDQKITMYLTDDDQSYRPKLSVGEQYIFLLDWNDAIGRYVDFHPYASYFKVDASNKVKTIYKSTTDFSELDNQSFDKVRQKIKDIVQQGNG